MYGLPSGASEVHTGIYVWTAVSSGSVRRRGHGKRGEGKYVPENMSGPGGEEARPGARPFRSKICTGSLTGALEVHTGIYVWTAVGTGGTVGCVRKREQ